MSAKGPEPSVDVEVARKAVRWFFELHAEAWIDRSLAGVGVNLFAQWSASAATAQRVTPNGWHRVRTVRPGGAMHPSGALAPDGESAGALGLDEFAEELIWLERLIDRLAGECAEGWHAALMMRLATGLYGRSALIAFPSEEHEMGRWSTVDWEAVRCDLGEPPRNRFPAWMTDGRGGLPKYRTRNSLIRAVVEGLVAVGFAPSRNAARRGLHEDPSAPSLVAEVVHRSESQVEDICAMRTPLPCDCPRFGRWELGAIEGERAAKAGEPRSPDQVRISDDVMLEWENREHAIGWLAGHDRVTGYRDEPDPWAGYDPRTREERERAGGFEARYDNRTPQYDEPPSD